jgi:ethanolamine permease
MAQKQVGSVTYTQADQGYFAQRGLRRYARVWSLWALGVGAVISGHYSGWNLGIGQGGFGGILIAGLVIMVMYWGLIFCIAEMSPALPHTGAAYSFARSAMGPWGGFVTGLAENIEYVLTPTVIVFFIGTYLSGIFGTPPEYQPLYWLGAYLIFLALNLFGVELSFRVSVLVTLGALGVLAIYWISAIPYFDFDRWALNIGGKTPAGELIELPNGNGPFLPMGWAGAFAALPFAVWLFLAIEQLPLAAEETDDPKVHMPKGLILGMSTLVLSAFLIVFLNSSVGSPEPDRMHGAFTLAKSGEPLLDGFRVTIGGFGATALALLAVIGLIASFHTIIYAYGRQIYSLSRAGYFPQALSVTHGSHKTPNRALIAGTVLGFGVMLVVWFSLGSDKGGAIIGGTLLNMAVFGAMLSYALQALSFIRLRQTMPHIPRPYRSPLGIPGAVVAIVIAVATLYYQLQDPAYRVGVLGVAAWYLAGIVYFALVGRHKLVLSPEEEFALTRGTHGHPETEGYGKTSL